MREDPDEAEKAEKKKKKRIQSAKRPLTAKKKKQDMMKGDIVSMVKTMTTSQAVDKPDSKKPLFPKAKGLK